MLKMDDDSATAIYHAFNMLCYFSPLFGAMLADSLLGKYKSVTFSLLQCSHHISTKNSHPSINLPLE